MATLEIPDMTFARLKANADARRVPLVDYLDSVAASDSNLSNRPSQSAPDFSAFIADAIRWRNENLPPGYEADDSRESIYADRD